MNKRTLLPIILVLSILLMGTANTPEPMIAITGFDPLDFLSTKQNAAGIPATVAADLSAPSAVSQMPMLSTFTSRVANQVSNQVVGVYVPGLFALPVVQQPAGQGAYVSTENDTVTQFSLANKYNVIGLLAHNYLSGEEFFKLKPNQYVILVFGDGSMEYYRISSTQSYQALTPNSPFSDFVDLSDPAETRLSSTDLFRRVYTNAGQVVFQTCIKAFGDPSWGRLFVTAEKVDVRQPVIVAAN